MQTNLLNRHIYKDECTRCFLTPKDPHGLNVCLTCYEGSCAAPGECHDHTATHHALNAHPIYMNIKMVEKPAEKDEEGEDKPKEITKLAIGKPGGVDLDTDKYDTLATVFCYGCQKELPLDAVSKPLVDSVLLANSAFNASTIAEWEVKLNDCEHTVTLD